MTYTPEQIIFSDDLSDDRTASVRDALRADADLRAAVQRWVRLSTAVGDDLRRDLPPSEALVLFALRETKHADDLSDREQRLLAEATGRLETALGKHPAVRHILERIREDADDFARCWDNATGAPTHRLDRAPVRSRSRLRLVPVRWTAAAAAVVVVAITTFLLFGPDPTVNDRVTWTAADGTYRLVELPDGTDLRLAGPATLTYDSNDARSVDLTGSAYFDVTRGSTRFTIRTSNARVEVLGTSFGVLSDASSTEVTLVTGSLRFASLDGRAVQLEPGQSSRVEEAGAPAAPVRVDVTDVLRWTGLFVFRDTPITEVARALGEEYDISIDVSDELKDETLTGTFAEEQGVTEILRVISAAMSAELDISEEGTQYTLRR